VNNCHLLSRLILLIIPFFCGEKILSAIFSGQESLMLVKEYPHLQKKDGISLILSGGATKAFYFHLGVLNVLGTHDITSIVGSSAGAVMGAFIASGVGVDTLSESIHRKKVYFQQKETWARTLTSTMLFRPKYKSILRQSVMNSLTGLKFIASLPRLYQDDVVAKGIDHFIRNQSEIIGFFDSTALEDLMKLVIPSGDFGAMNIDLFVVATALDSNKRAIFNSHHNYEDEDDIFAAGVSIHRAIRASTAVPGMFEPIKINGKYYMDGEIKRTVSSDLGINLADKVIISHTYQPLYLNGHGSVRDMGWYNIIKQSVSMVLYERIQRQKMILNEEYPHKEVIWIQPDPQDVEFFTAPEFTFDPKVQHKIMACGERAALMALGLHQSKAS
jgi:predicted acylesterase/phospholipase RssA